MTNLFIRKKRPNTFVHVAELKMGFLNVSLEIFRTETIVITR